MNEMDEQIKEILDIIIPDDLLHARWLNTLSFLEHVGTRKIHKTQSGPALTDVILQHASEEARHAHFFKRMAEKVSPGSCPNYENQYLLAGYSGFRYFQSLDSFAKKNFPPPAGSEIQPAFLCYLYVTTMIEERAGWLYPIYEERLKAHQANFTISSVITDEEGHLKTMYELMEGADPSWKNRMNDFRLRELTLYNRLVDSVAEKAGLVYDYDLDEEE